MVVVKGDVEPNQWDHDTNMLRTLVVARVQLITSNSNLAEH